MLTVNLLSDPELTGRTESEILADFDSYAHAVKISDADIARLRAADPAEPVTLEPDSVLRIFATGPYMGDLDYRAEYSAGYLVDWIDSIL